jgi:hypothetical protein
MKRALAAMTATFLLVYLSVVAANPEEGEKAEASPHAEAIQLVMNTQQETIRKVDQGNWWHDVKERAWQAKRPFAPGAFDSTRLFVVSYHIEGKAVCSWSVDTRARKVRRQELPENKAGE